jgi:hypothetical protein
LRRPGCVAIVPFGRRIGACPSSSEARKNVEKLEERFEQKRINNYFT